MRRREESSTVKITKWQLYLSIITVNIHGLNSPTKKHRLADWIKK
jgi:hypothetical protein